MYSQYILVYIMKDLEDRVIHMGLFNDISKGKIKNQLWDGDLVLV